MGVHNTAKSSYLSLKHRLGESKLRAHTWFLEQEVDTWSNWLSLPPSRRLWLWRHGFTSPCDVMYDLNTHGPDAYMSELQRYRFYNACNGKHRYLLDDKLSQHRMLSAHPDHCPTAYGFVDRGFVHGLAMTEFDGGPVPVSDWLPDALRDHSKLVLKQLRGQGGSEVLVCSYDGEYQMDGATVSEATLCGQISDLSGYLVTEHVSQHEYADQLYPNAANTVRILTIWDDRHGELLVPMAIHRIGTDRSSPLDNFSAGGLTAEIHMETGTIGEAVAKPKRSHLEWHTDHPDTGTEIAGTTVPEWDAIRSTVERLALDNTDLPAIGWDILLDSAGTPVVLEANTGTDVDLMQVHRPLLADDDVRRVVERHCS